MGVGPYPVCCCDGTPWPFDIYCDSLNAGDWHSSQLVLTPSRWPAGVNYVNDGITALFTSAFYGWGITIHPSDPSKDVATFAGTLAIGDGVVSVRDFNEDHPDWGWSPYAGVAAALNNWRRGPDAKVVNSELFATETPTEDAWIEASLAIYEETDYRLWVSLKYTNYDSAVIRVDLGGTVADCFVSLTTPSISPAGFFTGNSVEVVADNDTVLVMLRFTTPSSMSSPTVRVYLSGSSSLEFSGALTDSIGIVTAWMQLNDENYTFSSDVVVFDIPGDLCTGVNYIRFAHVETLRSEYIDWWLSENFWGNERYSNGYYMWDANYFIAPTMADANAIIPHAAASSIGNLGTGFEFDDFTWVTDVYITLSKYSGFSVSRKSSNGEVMGFWNVGSLGSDDDMETHGEGLESIYEVGASATGRHLGYIGGKAGTAYPTTITRDHNELLTSYAGTWNAHGSGPNLYGICGVPPNDYPNCFGIKQARDFWHAESEGEISLPWPPPHPDILPIKNSYEGTTAARVDTAAITFGAFANVTVPTYNPMHDYPYETDGGGYGDYVAFEVGLQDTRIINGPSNEFWGISKTNNRLLGFTTETNLDSGPSYTAYAVKFSSPSDKPSCWVNLLWGDSYRGDPGAIFYHGEVDLSIQYFTSIEDYDFEYKNYYERMDSITVMVHVKIGGAVVHEAQIYSDPEALSWHHNNLISDGTQTWFTGLRALPGPPGGGTHFAYFEKLWESEPTAEAAGVPASPPWRLHLRDADGTSIWTLDGGYAPGSLINPWRPWVVFGSDRFFYVGGFVRCDARLSGGDNDYWVFSYEAAEEGVPSSGPKHIFPPSIEINSAGSDIGAALWGFFGADPPNIQHDCVKVSADIFNSLVLTAWPNAPCEE